ncbi:MAG: MFS transporter [Novosphingobium sp.]
MIDNTQNPDNTRNNASRLTAPGSTLAPLRYSAFRAIWTANLFSAIGSTVQSVGAAWLMTELTTSHRLIALVQASVTLPIMLFGVIAGAIADNFDRRRVMLAAQIGMLVMSAALALMTYKALIGPYTLLAFTLSVGIGTALNSPAWQASVRGQVAREDLPQAIALNTAAFNLARSVGPALGGLLISVFSVSAAFLVNAVSYIALIWVLLRWRPEAPTPVRAPMLPSIRTGLAFCFGSVPLRKLLIRGFCVGFGIAGYQALVPAVVRDQLHGNEFDFGLLLTSFGLGSILSIFFLSPARRRWGSEVVISVGMVAYVVAPMLLPGVSSVIAALPIGFIAGLGWTICLNSLNVAVQLRAPEQILGRCLSIYSAMAFGGMSLGAWIWGAVADWHGLPVALWSAAGWMALCIIVLHWVAPMPKPHEGRIAYS